MNQPPARAPATHRLQRLTQLFRKHPDWTFAGFLLLAALLAYAAQLPWLGFYWDDWPLIWIASRFGGGGLADYHATNRPVWDWFYQITMPLLGSTPWVWQAFAILWRWLAGLALAAALRSVWPRRLAQAAALLFVIYPGFTQQYISVIYSHFFMVLVVFFLSLLWMVRAARAQTRRAFAMWFGLALAASALHLFSMEYFFFLDLLRPVFLWLALARYPTRQRLQRVAGLWLPFLLVMAADVLWRSALLGYHTYQPVLLATLRADPLLGLAQLTQLAAADAWQTLALAWGQVFHLPQPAQLGQRTWLIWLAVTLGAGLLTGLWALWLSERRERETTADGENAKIGPAFWLALATGLAGLVLAGGPFWMTGLPVGLTFANDRFTLPFSIGAALVVAALLALLEQLPGRARRAGELAAALILLTGVGLASGQHLQNASAYRRDWQSQRTFFWQLAWRAPGLLPNTMLLTNDLPLTYYSDNSMTAPLNWVYASRSEPIPGARAERQMPYLLAFPSIRVGSRFESLQAGQPVYVNYLAADFNGNTSQSLAVVYQPPACLRVLDPEIDELDIRLPLDLRAASTFTNAQVILPEGQPNLTPAIFGAEPAANWCYYFERADLARQQDDWAQVAALAGEAFSAGDYPNDPAERFPFIEGYAHTGDWASALEQTRAAADVTAAVRPSLCRLWARIERETPSQPERDRALTDARAALDCESSY